MAAKSSTKKVIYAALIGNSLIALTKFAAAAVTGSSAMLAEGIHSTVDLGNQVLLLYGLRAARRPADREFPFGHGKEIYFWGFVVAILIFAVGAGVSVYEGINQLRHPHPVQSVVVNYVVLGFATVFESFAFGIALREFRAVKGDSTYLEAIRLGKDPSVFVVLFEDGAALSGLLIAFLGILLGQVTGITAFDGIASILIGLILAGTATWLAYETKSLLIGESASPAVVAGAREIASRHPSVEHVNEVLTLHMGPDFVLLNLSVDFRDGASTGELESGIAALDREIKAAFPVIRRIFIEAEARPGSSRSASRAEEEHEA